MNFKPEAKNVGILRRAEEWIDRMLTSGGRYTTRERAVLLDAGLDAVMRSPRGQLKKIYFEMTKEPLEVAARGSSVDFVDGYGHEEVGSPDPLDSVTDPKKRAALQEALAKRDWTGWKGIVARRLNLGSQSQAIDMAKYRSLLDSS